MFWPVCFISLRVWDPSIYIFRYIWRPGRLIFVVVVVVSVHVCIHSNGIEPIFALWYIHFFRRELGIFCCCSLAEAKRFARVHKSNDYLLKDSLCLAIFPSISSTLFRFACATNNTHTHNTATTEYYVLEYIGSVFVPPRYSIPANCVWNVKPTIWLLFPPTLPPSFFIRLIFTDFGWLWWFASIWSVASIGNKPANISIFATWRYCLAHNHVMTKKQKYHQSPP